VKSAAPALTVLLTALLTLTACEKDDKTSTETKTETTETKEKEAETKTPEAKTPEAKTPAVTKPGSLPAGYTLVPPVSTKPVREFGAEPAMTLEDNKDYYALFDTARGQILIDLYEQETPVTVNNFVTLARNRFYDATRFHRVIEGFMAQGGDPSSTDESKKASWGMGGPGYTFADEFRTRLQFTGSGILAMANSGPATNGSQFFITFAPTDFLNGKHTIFGKVVKGEDVLPKLTRTMDGSNAEIPDAVPDRILSVRILSKAR